MAFKKLYLDITPLIILICCFGFIMSAYLGIIQIPYIRQETYNSTKIWVYDVPSYIRNIQYAFTDTKILELELPTTEFEEITGTVIDASFWSALFNNICVVFNWIYMPINVILYPIRILAYVIRGSLTILGCVASETILSYGTYQPMWFMDTLSWISANLSIPYIGE